jgi:pimeloyl-ACP methyl ester carboxylesterase
MESVVVAHGLWMPGWETAVLRRRLARAGFAPCLFRFPSVGETLGANAERLARFAAKVPGEVVHFVGYSLGGVVTLTMLEAQPPARPGRVVCLGSPLNGSCSGRRLAALPGGARLLGRCMGELHEHGGVPPWTARRDLGIIAGNVAVGFGRLLDALQGPNDGTVAVAETMLEGAAAHLVLPVSHTSMLFSPTVAAQTVHFLRNGQFRS